MSFRFKKSGKLLIVAAGIAVAILVFFMRNDEPVEPVLQVPELHVALASGVGSLDLARSLRSGPYPILSAVYETLVISEQYCEDDCRVQSERYLPALASNWETSDGERTWIFHLRRGHYFSDGSQVNAAAVKFSFDRILGLGRGPASALSFIDNIEIIDDDTLKFNLREQSPMFLAWLASPLGHIINPAVLGHENDGDFASHWLGQHTAGSGAFQLTSISEGGFYVLERNPHYQAKTGVIERVVFELVKDESIRRLRLEKGDFDIAYGFAPATLAALEDVAQVSVHSAPAPIITFLAMNTRKGLMAEQRIRRAISHAIDYHSIVDDLLLGRAELLSGPLPAGTLGSNLKANPPAYDPELARSLLEQAQLDISVPISLLYTGATAMGETLALVIQANLAEIGMHVEAERLSLSAMIDRAGQANYDMTLLGWQADGRDPSLTINFWLDPERAGPGGNLAFYDNERVGKLLKESLQEGDRQKRAGLIREAVDISMEEVPYIYLYQSHIAVVTHKQLQGFEFQAYSPFRLNIPQLSK